MSEDEVELYRHYDAGGYLLYVGISLSSIARLCEHKKEAEWFRKIVLVTIERFPSRLEAMKAEEIAILSERPQRNLRSIFEPPNYARTPLLNEATVIEMRGRRNGGQSISDIAKQFGVTRGAAQAAINGVTWRHVPGAVPTSRTITNVSTVRKVKNMLAAGRSYSDILIDTGLSRRIISRIATGERHSKVSAGKYAAKK